MADADQLLFLLSVVKAANTTLTANLNYIKGEPHINCEQCSQIMREMSEALKRQSDLLDQIAELTNRG